MSHGPGNCLNQKPSLEAVGQVGVSVPISTLVLDAGRLVMPCLSTPSPTAPTTQWLLRQKPRQTPAEAGVVEVQGNHGFESW